MPENTQNLGKVLSYAKNSENSEISEISEISENSDMIVYVYLLGIVYTMINN